MPKEKLEYRPARDALILRLFLSGNTYRTIGQHPKVRLSPAGVSNVLKKQLATAAPRQLAEQGVTVYVERLEMMLRSAWPKAVSGDLRAISVVLRVLKQEAKFHSLDLDGVTDDDLLAVAGLSPLDSYRQRRP